MAWLMAVKGKDRFAELNSTLDWALVVFFMHTFHRSHLRIV
jgi:hypothetical protein